MIGKKIGIYKITNPVGAIYIGQSRNISKRFNSYRNKVEKNKGQPKLYNSLLKYGHKAHKFEIIQECEFSELNVMERYWQEFYNACNRPNLNCTLTSVDEKPSVVSEETRRKMSIGASERMSLRIKDPEWMEKMRLAGIKKRGKKLPPFSESHKAKLRESIIKAGNFKGEKNPNFGRGKGSENPMYGRSHSEETINKIREKAVGRKMSAVFSEKMSIRCSMGGNPRAKIVLNIEDGIFYGCMKEAWMSQTRYAYTTLKGKVNGSVKNNTPFRLV